MNCAALLEAEKRATMCARNFPAGWDEERVRDVLAHYEDQTEDEQFAEIEAAREREDVIFRSRVGNSE